MPQTNHLSFIDTDKLRVGFEESGPADAPAVVLVHGWPDDVRTWDPLLKPLRASGYRVIRPFLRGYGPTRFLSDSTPRSGQLAALGADLMAFADALGLQRYSVIGHDWGARAAYIAASQTPQRIAHCIAISVGWGTNTPDQQLSLQQSRNYWYHWFFATPRGEAELKRDRRAFARFMWNSWSPSWNFADSEFGNTAASFDNPDWADICLHSYRHRWGFAEGDADYAELDARLAQTPRIMVPTLMLHGAEDGANHPATSEGKDKLFGGGYKRVVIEGAGHFPQREKSDEVIAEVMAWLES
ncbi:alpha/beta hydrolase [Herbaspirillum sp. WKF16]|jgi:pimeloyl-ACP methyl ester carboxylesterase|uniref:alpha/beta fold hydrolase n=1 Tax=Herbaspirillum sp. WKF16 TaxID=3028312 RepID=UPI0023A92A00|nr:alpha/beta hydrolase [Herbaspirillum sp. WKF16]WDZ94800.1 alpha/beta hydrolase [Herbaspirillum sp. WKF16]